MSNLDPVPAPVLDDQPSLVADVFASQDGDAALAAFEPDALQAERAKQAAAVKKIALQLDLQLVEPIQLGKETISVLYLTEPTMKQLRESQRAATPLGGLSILIQLNTGVLPAVVDKLKQRDINAIDTFFGAFSRA